MLNPYPNLFGEKDVEVFNKKINNTRDGSIWDHEEINDISVMILYGYP